MNYLTLLLEYLLRSLKIRVRIFTVYLLTAWLVLDASLIILSKMSIHWS